MARGIFVASNTLQAAQLNDCFDPPRCRLFNSANISVANTTNTVLTFDTETYDSGGMHSTSSNTGRITVPTGGSGWYVITGGAEFAANATGQRDLTIRLNGSLVIGAARATSASGSVATRLMCTTQYPLSDGDYVELLAYQTSGGALNVVTGSDWSPIFMACWTAVL